MKKYPLQISEAERRRHLRRFRLVTISEWISVPFIVAMVYFLTLWRWDSHLLAAGSTVVVSALRFLLLPLLFRSARKLHKDTWHLVRNKLSLDTFLK